VIGLDMTPKMIKLARRNARKIGATNVEFRYGEMEDIPLPDESVDAIISNCVINLSPDKDAVFTEAYRVLKPGGRMSISDIVTNGELPEAMQRSVAAWTGCISGALDEALYLDKMRQAGFADVQVTARSYLDVEGFLAAPDVQQFLAHLPEPVDLAELATQSANKVASIKVKAYKRTEQ